VSSRTVAKEGSALSKKESLSNGPLRASTASCDHDHEGCPSNCPGGPGEAEASYYAPMWESKGIDPEKAPKIEYSPPAPYGDSRDWRSKDRWNYYHRRGFVPLTEYDQATGEPMNVIWTKEAMNEAFLEHPGAGEARPMCGQVTHVVQCPEGCQTGIDENGKPVFRQLLSYHCDRWTCPTDYRRVIRSQTATVCERFEQVTAEYKKARVFKGSDKHLNHWAISPPRDIFPDAESFMRDKEQFPENFAPSKNSYKPQSFKNLDKLKLKAYNLMKAYAKSFYGGVLVFHAYRRKHEDGSGCESKNCKRDHTWEWGPHFHYIGHGIFPANLIYEKSGWIFQRIKTAPGEDRSFSATFSYVLSHASIMGKRYVVEIDREEEMGIPLAMRGQRPVELVRREQCRQNYWWVGAYVSKNIERIEEPAPITPEEEVYKDGELVKWLRKDLCPHCQKQRWIVRADYYPDLDDWEEAGEPSPACLLRGTVTTYTVRESAIQCWRDKYRPPPGGYVVEGRS